MLNDFCDRLQFMIFTMLGVTVVAFTITAIVVLRYYNKRNNDE